MSRETIMAIKLPVSYDAIRECLIDADGRGINPFAYKDKALEIADALNSHAELLAKLSRAEAMLGAAEKVLNRIEDVQHGGADDETLLKDVDALRRQITRHLRPAVEHEPIEL